MHDAATPETLSRYQILWLAVACGVVVANAYYIHPIISLIAEEFDIRQGMIGLVPALNQVALALGILLILPLGDLVSNRRLTWITALLQTVCVAIMALAPGFLLFTAASTLLGFVTLGPYILPTFASKRVAPEQLGYVTAMLTTGIIIGILIARAGAGIVAEYVGWRPVYWIAAALMLATTLILPRIMASERVGAQRSLSITAWGQLLASLTPLVARKPEVIISGAIQALGFGVFLAIWMGIGLHLPSAEMGYGVDVVGYLALIAVVSMVSTPRLGRWADRIGARKARVYIALIQTISIGLFLIAGQSLWLMVLPILLTNAFGPSVDVTGRMTFLSEAPDIRTRLMTIYIVLMFLGGGAGSWLGTASYAWGGWLGTSGLCTALSALMLGLSWFSYRRWGKLDKPAPKAVA
ncbi:MAG: MFS transporter [Pseudomonadota bacterium]